MALNCKVKALIILFIFIIIYIIIIAVVMRNDMHISYAVIVLNITFLLSKLLSKSYFRQNNDMIPKFFFIMCCTGKGIPLFIRH